MNTEVLVDALPYFDIGFDDPGVRETVNKCKIYICLHSISIFQKYFFRLSRWLMKNAVDISQPKIILNIFHHSTHPASKQN